VIHYSSRKAVVATPDLDVPLDPLLNCGIVVSANDWNLPSKPAKVPFAEPKSVKVLAVMQLSIDRRVRRHYNHNLRKRQNLATFS